MRIVRISCLSILLVVLASAAAGEEEKNFWEGKNLPSMSVRSDQWVNLSRAPHKRGKVIWIQFGHLDEIRCRDFDFQLVSWDKNYRKKGLVVIEVFDGTKDRRSAVAKHSLTEKKKFGVLWDKEGKLVEKFRIRAYPTSLLVDRYGKVVWVGDPLKERASLRSWIERELARPGPEPEERAPGPSWLTEEEAFALAKEDKKWVLLFKWSPASPAASKLRKTLRRPDVVAYLDKHFHCVVADHPKHAAQGREPAIWHRSDLWDEDVVLWLIRFDDLKHVAIDHLDKGKPVDAPKLLARLEAVK